ncbi:MAG: 7-cyano-7-deazaguanine synthase QueC [Rhodospirillaceae bacterium]|nr:7-cyano-7-deazaguanine synthase QueC [Rhodospirillaceae bacterium]|tara:strand:- start:34680 stop:35408 length:729 start_codon:yes stop_codon:yes gene_type:complete
MTDETKALVLFSGGQDSSTCLAWAIDQFTNVETVGFDYGQRHSVELDCREQVLAAIKNTFPPWKRKLGSDHLHAIPVLGNISETALTRDTEIAFAEGGLPNTFVPGRNLVFLTLAAAIAYRRGIRHIVLGVGEVDYSGYPDCRSDAITAMENALNIGMDSDFVLHTPLMHLDKTAIWELADQIGGTQLTDIIVEYSHSCYLGDRNTRHDWGYGCGGCPACALRAAGHEGFIEKIVKAHRPIE